MEVGSRTRRRPIKQDYAAAKDAEVEKIEGEKVRRSEAQREERRLESEKIRRSEDSG